MNDTIHTQSGHYIWNAKCDKIAVEFAKKCVQQMDN